MTTTGSDLNQPPTELFARSTQGDRSALESLIGRYLPRLHAFVRIRMGADLRGREDSLDLVQSVCGELIEHQDLFAFQGEAQFRGWLFKSALNKIREKYRFHHRERRDPRREAAQPGSSGGSSQLDRAFAQLPSPSMDLAGRERVAAIEAALDRLSPAVREAIVLTRIVGMTSREAGAELGKSPAAVRKLLSRGLLQLAEELAAGSRLLTDFDPDGVGEREQ